MLRAKKAKQKKLRFSSLIQTILSVPEFCRSRSSSCLLCAASFTSSAARRRVADFYRRSGIPVHRAGKLTSLNWNRAPCPEELTVFYRELYAGEKEIASANSIPPLFTPFTASLQSLLPDIFFYKTQSQSKAPDHSCL